MNAVNRLIDLNLVLEFIKKENIYISDVSEVDRKFICENFMNSTRENNFLVISFNSIF